MYASSILNERGSEFENISVPQSLSGYDKNISYLLTPNPKHNLDKLGRGKTLQNIGAMSMKKDYGVRMLESKYLDNFPIMESNDELYDMPMTRTLVIS